MHSVASGLGDPSQLPNTESEAWREAGDPGLVLRGLLSLRNSDIWLQGSEERGGEPRDVTSPGVSRDTRGWAQGREAGEGELGNDESEPGVSSSFLGDSVSLLRFNGFLRAGGVWDLTRKENLNGVDVVGDSERDLSVDLDLRDKPSDN